MLSAAPSTMGKGALNRLPTETPPFTLSQLKAVIPAHCFKRNTLTSLKYTVNDLIFVAIFYYMSTLIPSAPEWSQYLLWPLYWAAQGCVCTGLWVIAHECGHRAFSDNTFLGDCVGLPLHSIMLVPYHSWRISHGKHHANTNSMENDEVFVPYTRSEFGDFPSPLSVASRCVNIFKMLVFGWPAYLITHVTGKRYGAPTSHVNPWCPLFLKKDFWNVILSDVAIFGVLFTIGYSIATFGFTAVFNVYIVPYLIVNMWLVLITDLQHTDPSIPHYRTAEWTWLKGALCTLDRDYGFLNSVFHHIGDTHVAHHIFSHMPHYHAEEATRAIIPVLGKFYVRDSVAPGLRGICQALWKTSTECRWVDDNGGVLWFKSS